MALWSEKYRPKSLTEMDYNLEQVNYLRKLLSNPNFPHLSIFGTSGKDWRKTNVIFCHLYTFFLSSRFW